METKTIGYLNDQRRFHNDVNQMLLSKSSLPTLTKNNPSTLYNFQPSSPKISLNKNTSTFQEYINYILAERMKKSQEALNNSKEDNKLYFNRVLHSKNPSQGKIFIQRDLSLQSLTDREKMQNLIERPTIEKLFPDIVNKNIQKQSLSAGRKAYFQSNNLSISKSTSQEKFKYEQLQEPAKYNYNQQNQDISVINNSPNYQSIDMYQLRNYSQQNQKEQTLNQNQKNSYNDEYGSTKNRYFQFDTSKNEAIKEKNIDNFIEVDQKLEEKSNVSIIEYDQNEQNQNHLEEDAKKSEHNFCNKNQLFPQKMELNLPKQIIVIKKQKNKLNQQHQANQQSKNHEIYSKQQELNAAKQQSQNIKKNSFNTSQQFYFQSNPRPTASNTKQTHKIYLNTRSSQLQKAKNDINQSDSQEGINKEKVDQICEDMIKKQNQEQEPSFQLHSQTTQPSLKYLIDKSYKKEFTKPSQNISKDNNSVSIMINQTASPKIHLANGIKNSQTQIEESITSDKQFQAVSFEFRKNQSDNSITSNNIKQIQNEQKHQTSNIQKLSQIIKSSTDKLKLSNYKKQVQMLKFSIQEEKFQLKKAFDQILQINNAKNKFLQTFTTVTGIQQTSLQESAKTQVQKTQQNRIENSQNTQIHYRLNDINQENSITNEDQQETKDVLDSSIKDYLIQKSTSKYQQTYIEDSKLVSIKKQDKIDFYKLRLYYGNKYESKLASKNIKQINQNAFRERSFTNNTPEISNNMQLDPWESNHSDTLEEYEYYLQI